MLETLPPEDQKSAPIVPRQHDGLHNGLRDFRFNYDPRNRLSVGKISNGIDVSGSPSLCGFYNSESFPPSSSPPPNFKANRQRGICLLLPRPPPLRIIAALILVRTRAAPRGTNWLKNLRRYLRPQAKSLKALIGQCYVGGYPLSPGSRSRTKYDFSINTFRRNGLSCSPHISLSCSLNSLYFVVTITELY